ncbi:hypothetical protein [Methanothermococcus okinawensis]|uniref:DUF5671 domain-containing protein n=1 Tax=Methanothermococcus okinawensis (strain DSM 14208 / JCM 11175 / IH1) TaxID=647113 RepID=F8AN48_METOI|nr:hypothetical protein [Methanothermococcus okinawensis]AEH06962.1 hypothetical protein Metok_0992 [Methanothermococcus okinawensis IH1]
MGQQNSPKYDCIICIILITTMTICLCVVIHCILQICCISQAAHFNNTYIYCGIISVVIMLMSLVVQGYLNKSERGFVLTKGEVRRSLAISITTFYFLTMSLILSGVNTTLLNNNINTQIINNLHWVIMSVFGFYFGFRYLDSWARQKTLKEILGKSPESLKSETKLKLKDEEIKNILYEVLNIRKK